MRDETQRSSSTFHKFAAAVAVLLLGGLPALAEDPPRTPAPPDVSLYILSPHPGELVSSPVTVRFGLSGMGVAPAGVINPKTGHHHLIIDAPLPDFSKPVPADANHLHFGGGQTEVQIELTPGTHTLQLVLGDHLHIPFQPPIVSTPIEVRVK